MDTIVNSFTIRVTPPQGFSRYSICLVDKRTFIAAKAKMQRPAIPALDCYLYSNSYSNHPHPVPVPTAPTAKTSAKHAIRAFRSLPPTTPSPGPSLCRAKALTSSCPGCPWRWRWPAGTGPAAGRGWSHGATGPPAPAAAPPGAPHGPGCRPPTPG